MNRPADAPILVIGGGLAGIAAALVLADAKRAVVLCERRPFLGGRAFSFRDPGTGAVLDNGQHVLVGACDRLRALLGRIGSGGSFARQKRLALPILDGRGRVSTLAAPPLPPPLHAWVALLRYRHLGPRAKLSVAASARHLVRTTAAERRTLDDEPLGVWLARRGAPSEALERFWDPIVRPALNIRASEASVPLTAFLLERALWAGPRAGALWLPRTGLGDAIGTPATDALARAGVEVRSGVRCHRLRLGGGAIAGAETSAGPIDAAAVVVAVPPDDLDALLPEGAAPTAPYAAIGASPIVNVYLWYDRPVARHAFAGVLDSDVQWVFDRTRLLGADAAGGECIGISLSAADEWIDRPKDEIAARCDRAVARLFPDRDAARLLASAVVKEPRATFRAGPGLAGLRPGPVGPAPGVFLAGDWTDTGWPATMEGAVRSGEAAARAVLSTGSTRPPGPP